MQFVQPLKLVVYRNKLVSDVGCIFDTGEMIQHRLDLCLAGDQDAALW
jgi:hypothetical protein